MKKKFPSRAAFLNPRLLVGLFFVLIGLFVAIAGVGVLTAPAANVAKALGKYKIISDSSDALVPVGFDCSTIAEKGIDKQENLRAGAIMIACGEAAGGSTSATSTLGPIGRFIQKLFAPLAYGAADVDLITDAENSPHTTQAETFTTANPDNPDQIVVAYNDSRGRYANPINISGASVSTDGGTTFTRLTTASGQSPFTGTVGDPVVLYNKPSQTWFTVWLDSGCGSQGIGGYKSTTPWDPNSWTHYCIHSGSSDDRESGWADNNPSSSHYGRMYVSWNDYGRGHGIFLRYSDDGVTWTDIGPLPGTGSSPFIRNVQITGDLVTGDLYLAGMNEGSGAFNGPRNNLVFRSTDGGATWTNTYTGPTFNGPGRCQSGYFACMYCSPSPGYWRHEGWGQIAAFNHVVHYDYAAGVVTDPGNVFYIRSADSGVTFSAPFQLNTDATTSAQWEPNLSVSPSGTVLAAWYDERNGGSCTAGQNTPCYQMFARKSNDNGATWLPDDALSDVISPLPAQPDSGIVGSFVGDYDYGSALATKHMTSWVDGRVPISGSYQQDAFTERELVGFAATTTEPVCNSVINTQPVDFTINLNDAADPSTVDATDFTVNGISADSLVSGNGNQQITFHFNSSPVVAQGLQTMHIPAGAFNRTSDNQQVFDFTCTFRFGVLQLQVLSTVPAVGDTFSPAPNAYQYDVNFNEPVDPASVQTSDLTVTGNSGPNVTEVSVINGNMTARCTLQMNFGGALTASIAAGAITDQFGNPNAAFTGNYAVQGCPSPDHYNVAQISDGIVPGTADTGNHGDDVVTAIALPFTYTLYRTNYMSVNVSSNGNAQFTTADLAPTNLCLPWTNHSDVICPYWDDLRTDNLGFAGCTGYPGGTCGIYTSVSGSAPNRVFNIEWRAVYFNNNAQQANYELRLYEGQTRFDVIYGTVAQGSTSACAGVQKKDPVFDQYFCNGSGGGATGAQSYTLPTCSTPTPTPTPTATATPTATPTPTPTPTPCMAPSAPSVQSATSINFASFTANWSSVSGATGYRLDVSLSSAFTTYVPGYQNLNVGNRIKYDVTGLSANTTYYYRVRAYNGCATSSNSSTKSLRTMACTPGAPSVGSAANVTFSSFSANWVPVSGAVDYRLDVSTSSSFTSYVPGYQDLHVGNVITYPVTGLNPSTYYYYRVRSYNGCAASANSSSKRVLTLPCMPAAPSAGSATNVTFSSFRANWSGVSGAIDYRLDVSTSSSFTSYVPGYQDLDVGNVTGYTVTGLNPSTTYYYRVRAYNGCATSANSSTKSVLTPACTPAAPSAQRASNVTTSSFSANWRSVSGAIDYRLDVSTSSTFTTYVPGYQDLSVGNVITFSVSGLNSQTIYYYRVRAYNGCNASANSSVISVTTL